MHPKINALKIKNVKIEKYFIVFRKNYPALKDARIKPCLVPFCALPRYDDFTNSIELHHEESVSSHILFGNYWYI